MIIKKVAFGNFDEAYIESRLTEAVNIIFSSENNKGKTLVVQGLMYALGNTPIFPADFNYQDYFFYCCIDVKGKDYEFLRKNNSIIIKENGKFHIFDSISDLKYFIDKNIFSLPQIEKNGMKHIVGPSLFYQLFFIGQDKRNTSNIQNSGQYNKNDFMSMLYSLNGVQQPYLSAFDIETIKNQIKEKQTRLEEIKRKIKLLPKDPNIAAQMLQHANEEQYQKQFKVFQDINDRISELKNRLLGETNRKIKLGNLILELNSLNKTISVGKLVCGKCGSDKIVFSSRDLDFELSNDVIRKQVLNSISEQIIIKEDKIAELSENLDKEQERYSSLIKATPVDVRSMLIFSGDLLPNASFSAEISKLNKEIKDLSEALNENKKLEKHEIEKNKSMIDLILARMNDYYKNIDPSEYSEFNSLFTKGDVNYSGSQEQEFYFCKLLAINSYFNHQFPIIMDSFRSGEISTSKEQKMINYYVKLNKQVILTATLKDEENKTLKYGKIQEINAISYNSHKEKHILDKLHVNAFGEILSNFNIIKMETEEVKRRKEF